ncbi:Apc13p protein-domain-containing protein [Hypoxylon crocopeplum]|nr:Apc13p protein-domain-containing protein [Hypoxylon crocopeplum]
MFFARIAILAAMVISPLDLATAVAVAFTGGLEGDVSSSSSELMRQAALSNMITESAVEHVKQRRDAVHRCHQPTAEFGPGPPVEDCKAAIKQLQAVKEDIVVQLVEGCYQVTSGNCTGSVCPQRVGTSTISPSLAAQYMADSIMAGCIANGLRGCCYTYVHMQQPRDADMFEDFCKDKLPDDEIYVPPHHQPINPEDEDDVVPDQHAAFGIQKATQRSKEPAWKDLGLAELMGKGPTTEKAGETSRGGSRAPMKRYNGLPR